MQPEDTKHVFITTWPDWSGLGLRIGLKAQRRPSCPLSSELPPSPQLVTRMPAQFNPSLLCRLDKP